jgi:hypothetical protein
MSALIAVWAWLQTQLASRRRGEDGWGAVEWMVIVVCVVGLAYTANAATNSYLSSKISEMWSAG